MKLKYILGIIFIIQGFYSFATAQYSDILIYNGKKYSLTVNPMEGYFKKYPEKRPKGGSTALWRGYVATFEIIDNELFVVDIEIENNTVTIIDGKVKNAELGWKSIINECLDGQRPMKVDWFSGLLILPQGKLVKYVHMGYGSTYEYYTLIEIENGNYIREFNLNNEQYNKYRNAQYEAYKKTNEYQEIFDKLNDGTMPDEMLDYFIKTYEIEYMTKEIEE
jgi:rRNA processing protein Krr1/Pno1